MLVTSYEDNRRYDHESKDRVIKNNLNELNELLDSGWLVESVPRMGGAGGAAAAIGGNSGMNDYRQFSSFAALVILFKSETDSPTKAKEEIEIRKGDRVLFSGYLEGRGGGLFQYCDDEPAFIETVHTLRDSGKPAKYFFRIKLLNHDLTAMAHRSQLRKD